MRVRSLVKEAFRKLFLDVDVLLTPSRTGVAPVRPNRQIVGFDIFGHDFFIAGWAIGYDALLGTLRREHASIRTESQCAGAARIFLEHGNLTGGIGAINPVRRGIGEINVARLIRRDVRDPQARSQRPAGTRTQRRRGNG